MNKNMLIETTVKNISTVMTEIEQGNLLIPPFQREFVWQREDVKQLFDSISRQYPIGSIILWKPREDSFKKDMELKIGGFTINSSIEKANGHYVLDGFQRLSSLFGCLKNPENVYLTPNEDRSNFELYYDLEDEGFLYVRNNNSKAWQVPVYVLFSTSDFRKYSRKYIEPFAQPDKIDLYLDRADQLSRSLLEYKIACISIENADINEAVDIFSRINSKGTEITFDWMVNALSYDEGYKFADKIDALLEDLEQYNWSGLSRNTVFRCVQSAFGSFYIDQTEIERLARRDDFKTVTSMMLDAIKIAVEFLYQELKVVNHKLLPYPAQLIFLSLYFMEKPFANDYDKEMLKEWFWKTTYTSYFTVNSLSVQRKAYTHFMDFINGYEVSPFYSDNKPYKLVSMPKVLSFGSVRAKAFILYILNNEIKDNIENCRLVRYNKNKEMSIANAIILTSNKSHYSQSELKEMHERLDLKAYEARERRIAEEIIM